MCFTRVSFLTAGLVLSSCALTAEVDQPEDDQPKDSLVEEVVVRSLRLEPTSATGTNLALITTEDIEASGVDYAVDALPSVSGLTVNKTGNFGGAAAVRIRGAASNQTLVLIDNVTVNDTTTPGGGYDFSRLDAGSIERIEVLKGAHSTLWGTDAIGGVVNVLTKRPARGFGVDLSAEYGSFDSRRLGGSLTAGSEVGDFRIGLISNETDGISKADKIHGNPEEDGYDSTTLSFRGGLNLPREARLNFALLSTESETEYDRFVFGAPGNVADGNEMNETEDMTAQISLDFYLFEGRLKNQVLIARSEIDRQDRGSFSFMAESERTLYRYQGNLTGDRYQLAFGVEREDVGVRVPINTGAAQAESSELNSLFAFYQYNFDSGLTASVGLRTNFDDEDESNDTVRLNLSYALTDSLSLYAGFGEGFKTPTLYQRALFFPPATEANSDLKSATSEAFDLGFQVQLSPDSTLSFNWFTQDTQNLINYVFTAGQYENIDEVESTGIELTLDLNLTPNFKLQGSYAFIEAKDAVANRPLNRIPRQTASLGISFSPVETTNCNFFLYYNDKEDDRSGVVSDWYRLDFNLRQQLTSHVNVFVRIENILDQHYQQVLGYGTPGRSVSAGIKFALR